MGLEIVDLTTDFNSGMSLPQKMNLFLVCPLISAIAEVLVPQKMDLLFVCPLISAIAEVLNNNNCLTKVGATILILCRGPERVSNGNSQGHGRSWVGTKFELLYFRVRGFSLLPHQHLTNKKM